jgi:hypothetical protein
MAGAVALTCTIAVFRQISGTFRPMPSWSRERTERGCWRAVDVATLSSILCSLR